MEKLKQVVSFLFSGIAVYFFDKIWGDKIHWTTISSIPILGLLYFEIGIKVYQIVLFIIGIFVVYLLYFLYKKYKVPTTDNEEYKGEEFRKGVFYYFVNAESKKVLDVAGGVALGGPPIIVWNHHDGGNQQWEFIKRGKCYLIKSRQDDRYLEGPTDEQREGEQIQIGLLKEEERQYWLVLKNSDGTYRLICNSSKKCLEANKDTAVDDGGKVIQQKYTGDKTQKWYIKPV